MKLNKLKSELLKLMLHSYFEHHIRVFNFDFFKKEYPNLNDEFISDALSAIQNDNFANIFFADGIAYSTTLLIDAIIQEEENTLIRKGYMLVKEIYSLIN